MSVRTAFSAVVVPMVTVGIVGILSLLAVPPPVAQAVGEINVSLAVSPSQPAVGQAADLTLKVFAVGGPMNIALMSAYPVEATRNGSSEKVTVTATAGDGGSYKASITFPSAGVWQLATSAFPNAPGNSLQVTVGQAGSSDSGGGGQTRPPAGPPTGAPPVPTQPPVAQPAGSPPAQQPAAAQGCQFQLGFAALHDMIPDVVGDCTSNEQHNPANGDALQQTTHGMLVWRKQDNQTAFTDGASTWINGPRGLQKRANDEHFDWETP